METSVLISVKRLCSIPKCVEIFIRFKVTFVFPTVTVSILTKKLVANSSLHACIGEGNGNSLQYSCLENPRDKRAWQATVHGVTLVGHDLATKPPPLQRKNKILTNKFNKEGVKLLKAKCIVERKTYISKRTAHVCRVKDLVFLR